MRSSPCMAHGATTFLIVMTFCTFLFPASIVEGVVGINWGRMATNRLIPSMVVDLLLQNGIHEVKLFSASANVLKAFGQSPISVTISVPSESLQKMLDEEQVRKWINDRIVTFQEYVKIRYVHVGADPFSKSYANPTYYYASDVLKLIQNNLNEMGYQNIKATIPHYFDVLKINISRPSEADFRDDIKERMVDILKFQEENDAPVFLDLFPIYYVHMRGWDPEFAFIDNRSNFSIVDDNGLIYRNAFDFIYDSFLWAIRKAGSPKVKLVVGQVGWPTDGYPNASPENAERFYKYLLPYVRSNKGTPLRPGSPIDVYLHSLSDENKLQINRGAFQRHWGIYRFDGVPKYKIDFRGQGRDIYPSVARGVIHMPNRWCIFNGQDNNLTRVKLEFEQTCMAADCTALAPGGSCSHLDYYSNISYAFNMYFQMKSQDVDRNSSCDFQGLGKVVPDDPSIGTCIFPVGILQAENVDDGLVAKTAISGAGERIYRLAFLLYLVLVFWVLI